MRRRRPSLRRFQRIYDRLRQRYFLAAPEGFYVPPPAGALHWAWLPDNAGEVSLVGWDEDGDPEVIRPYAKTTNIHADMLHELTHLRLGWRHRGACRRRSKAWRLEQLRLAQLGAPIL